MKEIHSEFIDAHKDTEMGADKSSIICKYSCKTGGMTFESGI